MSGGWKHEPGEIGGNHEEGVQLPAIQEDHFESAGENLEGDNMNLERMKKFVEKVNEEKCLKGHFVHGESTSCTGCGKDLEEILEERA